MSNGNLHSAKSARNDEFYTQWRDIESEMNAYLAFDRDAFRGKSVLCPCDDPELSEFSRYFSLNFDALGLDRLVCTCYAKGAAAQGGAAARRVRESPVYDPAREGSCGRFLSMERTWARGDGVVARAGYLEGDGDFRSEEVRALFGEADIVVTNPPFSLFREFVAQLAEYGLGFSVVGNVNAVTYREVFPLIREGKVWPGAMFNGRLDMGMPDGYELRGGAYVDGDGQRHGFVPSCCWLTNIDHGARRADMALDTMEGNLRRNGRLRRRLVEGFGQEEGDLSYPRYANADAIEVPYSECIPSDYNGLMGVPITYLGSHDPERFEIVGFRKGDDGRDLFVETASGKVQPYFRILIRRRAQAAGQGGAGDATTDGGQA